MRMARSLESVYGDCNYTADVPIVTDQCILTARDSSDDCNAQVNAWSNVCGPCQDKSSSDVVQYELLDCHTFYNRFRELTEDNDSSVLLHHSMIQ